MRDQAIRTVHPNVNIISGEYCAFDNDRNPVLLDEAKIAAEITKLQAAHAATQYRRDRVYPPIGDQLDDLFRQGAFSPEMAAALQAVKTAHPKGTL